jgi:hypothetical protein
MPLKKGSFYVKNLSGKINSVKIIYILILAAVCISMLFTNVGYDSEYQLSMAYRMIKGDLPLIQMWEPHQTSAFLCAILMKLYIAVTGTTTGIVLYTQAAGLLIRTGICMLLYSCLRRYTEQKAAACATLLYFIVSPKDILTPEFSNMQLWFATLLFLCLLRYFEKKRTYMLVLAAFSLCLGIFSYPSFALTFLAVPILLYKYSDKFWRDTAIFTGVCALIGGAFIAYLLSLADISTLIQCLTSALNVEPTHTVSFADKLFDHVKYILLSVFVLALISLAGYCIWKIILHFRHTDLSTKDAADRKIIHCGAVFISWFILLFLFLLNILSAEDRNAYTMLMLYMAFAGFCCRKKLDASSRKLYNTALLTGIGCLIAAMILSDHSFIQDVPYAQLFFCVSVLPLYQLYKSISDNIKLRRIFKACVGIFLLLLAFRCIYIHVPISGRGQIYKITEDSAFIRSGPGFGIYTNQEGAAMQRDSMEEWDEYIDDGDKIWILGDPVDTLGYLYKDVEVAAPTVMSTPSYTDALLYYWELNPDKYPDVLILSSGFGELSWDLLKNDWLMNWIEEEYQPATVVDGNYWRYYYKEERSFE